MTTKKNVKASKSVNVDTGQKPGADDTGPALEAKHAKAIECLISEKSVTAAAECAGVTRQTLHNWMQQPDFARALDTAQRDLLRHATRRLAGAIDKSVTTVVYLAETCEDEPTRLRAAMALPAMLRDLSEAVDIRDRLAAIEAAIELQGNEGA
jgi:hypothetical protein